MNRIALPLLMVLFLGNAVAQVLLEGHGLDNQTVNSYHPDASDAEGYASRAEQLAHGQFVAPFKDAYRLPGYPLFLSVFYRLSPQPLLAARYAQILLSASIPVLLFVAFFNVTGSSAKAYAGAVIVGLWAPLYYFSPVILAESCSIVLVGALMLCLSRVPLSESLPGVYAIPVLVASLVYLKPQHVLLFLPCVGFLIVARGKVSQRHLVGVGLALAALLAPWTLFASLANHTVVPLSTTSGLMLYLGTGVDTSRQESLRGTLHGRVAEWLGLKDEAFSRQMDREVLGMSSAEQSDHLTRRAMEAWTAHPFRVGAYGVSKVLHGFGFSLRGARDVVLAAMCLSGVIAALYAARVGVYPEWRVLFWASLLVTSVQMFVFAPDQRYKTVMFDLPGLAMIVLGWAASGRRWPFGLISAPRGGSPGPPFGSAGPGRRPARGRPAP